MRPARSPTTMPSSSGRVNQRSAASTSAARDVRRRYAARGWQNSRTTGASGIAETATRRHLQARMPRQTVATPRGDLLAWSGGMMRHRVGASIVALVVAAGPAPAQQSRIRPGDTYAVRYVFDGDTLEIGGVGRVRLLGIDAPELGSGFETPAPFAREARERLASLALRQWVRLEGDEQRRDTYGRALAYVFRTDGLLLNVELLRAGLARVSARSSL